MNNTIYCFWTGNNPMSENRKRCLEQLRTRSQCNVVLVTPENLSFYLLPEHPLHPAYEFLSQTHKADYLRTYFMNFIGGGYSDVKETTGSWIEGFSDLEKNEDKWINGYKEINGGVSYIFVRHKWELLIGNGAYICKPNTPLTNEWYSSMIRLLDERLELLRKHPARHPRDTFGDNGSLYPLEWNEMLGRIFHRVCYKYRDRLLNTLPISIFHSYL